MKTVEEIQAYLDSTVNTLLGQHRGAVQIVGIDEQPKADPTSNIPENGLKLHVKCAYVKMVGGCRGCAGAKYTLNMIVTNHIKTFDPSIDHVVDITDHTDKSNAFYKE